MFLIISHSFLLRIGYALDKRGENRTHLYSKTFFSKNCAICEIMWENIVDLDTPQMTI